MKISLKRTPEQVELIKAMASRNRQVAYEAQVALAEFIGPVLAEVINNAPTLSNLFTQLQFNADDNPSIPLDLYYDISDEDYITVYSQSAAGGVIPLENDKVCYLKSDASIGDMGFELVTHPHTLGAYEQATDLWAYIENLRSVFGARSWDTDSCGLHVHVSRAAFKSGAHTHRFLTLIYKNPKEMMKLAGRKNSRYAVFSDVYKPDEWGVPQFTLRDKIHGRAFTERYSAVNTLNDYTLELRFFRGTMAKSGILAALELAHAATEYTRDMTVSDVKLGMLKWEWFASWVESNNGLYPNLYVRMAKVPSVSLDNREMLNAQNRREITYVFTSSL